MLNLHELQEVQRVQCRQAHHGLLSFPHHQEVQQDPEVQQVPVYKKKEERQRESDQQFQTPSDFMYTSW